MTSPISADEQWWREEVEGERWYTNGTLYLPSITSVLNVVNKPQLEEWKRNQSLERMREELEQYVNSTLKRTHLIAALKAAKSEKSVASEAADYGTRAHEAVADLIEGKQPNIPSDVEPAVRRFQLWAESQGLELYKVEFPIATLDGQAAGTVDYVGYRPDKHTYSIVDWKTSKRVYPQYLMQVAAYAKAFEETAGKLVSDGWVVRARYKGRKLEFEDVEVNLKEGYEAFKAASLLWHFLSRMEK